MFFVAVYFLQNSCFYLFIEIWFMHCYHFFARCFLGGLFPVKVCIFEFVVFCASFLLLCCLMFFNVCYFISILIFYCLHCTVLHGLSFGLFHYLHFYLHVLYVFVCVTCVCAYCLHVTQVCMCCMCCFLCMLTSQYIMLPPRLLLQTSISDKRMPNQSLHSGIRKNQGVKQVMILSSTIPAELQQVCNIRYDE